MSPLEGIIRTKGSESQELGNEAMNEDRDRRDCNIASICVRALSFVHVLV